MHVGGVSLGNVRHTRNTDGRSRRDNSSRGKSTLGRIAAPAGLPAPSGADAGLRDTRGCGSRTSTGCKYKRSADDTEVLRNSHIQRKARHSGACLASHAALVLPGYFKMSSTAYRSAAHKQSTHPGGNAQTVAHFWDSRALLPSAEVSPAERCVEGDDCLETPNLPILGLPCRKHSNLGTPAPQAVVSPAPQPPHQVDAASSQGQRTLQQHAQSVFQENVDKILQLIKKSKEEAEARELAWQRRSEDKERRIKVLTIERDTERLLREVVERR